MKLKTRAKRGFELFLAPLLTFAKMEQPEQPATPSAPATPSGGDVGSQSSTFSQSQGSLQATPRSLPRSDLGLLGATQRPAGGSDGVPPGTPMSSRSIGRSSNMSAMSPGGRSEASQGSSYTDDSGTVIWGTNVNVDEAMNRFRRFLLDFGVEEVRRDTARRRLEPRWRRPGRFRPYLPRVDTGVCCCPESATAVATGRNEGTRRGCLALPGAIRPPLPNQPLTLSFLT